MKVSLILLQVAVHVSLSGQAQPGKETTGTQVKTANGVLKGTVETSGIRSFKGVPFAQPPVGELRWKEPQPVKNWTGVCKADQFGPKPMQLAVFGDMNSRSKGMSEDCLYLNVWTPAKSASDKLPQERPGRSAGAGASLPVLVYFYGGGWVAGDGSKPRYDGESMAQQPFGGLGKISGPLGATPPR